MLTLLLTLAAISFAFDIVGLILGITFTMIGVMLKVCFYLSPFGILYLILRNWNRCW